MARLVTSFATSEREVEGLFDRHRAAPPPQLLGKSWRAGPPNGVWEHDRRFNARRAGLGLWSNWRRRSRRSSRSRPRPRRKALFPFFGGGPSSYDIERRLEAGGYELTHPLVRRGDVYLADVVFGRDDAERLVIDAETGRIVQRFRSGWTRWRDAAPRPWDPERPDAWNAPPRPPADVDRGGPGETLDLPDARQGPRAPTDDQFARGEGATAPAVITGRGGARATPLDLIERPKSKPSEAKRKTTTPAPVAAAATPRRRRSPRRLPRRCRRSDAAGVHAACRDVAAGLADRRAAARERLAAPDRQGRRLAERRRGGEVARRRSAGAARADEIEGGERLAGDARSIERRGRPEGRPSHC